MYNGSKTGVIIAAAGSGTRMGSAVPKQFLVTGGMPVVVRAAAAFGGHPSVDDIVVVTDGAHVDTCAALLRAHNITARVTEGGSTRQESVRLGLGALPSDTRYVLIHDGARPYVKKEVIDRVLEGTARAGACVPCVPVKDTIRQKTPGAPGRSETLDRSGLFAVQTPQGFLYDVIADAHEKALAKGFTGTDDSVLCEEAGHEVLMCEGDNVNIKITTPDDVPAETRTGIGYDVHRLVPGRKLVLGGVELPYEKGLLGHSDADVLIHAVMDALLGASGLGDIGKLFPDSDPAYEGISSVTLLERVSEHMRCAGCVPVNVDVVVIAQRPKISGSTSQMEKNIADALGIAPGQVNVKGTTTEGLGFTGTGEGIAAQAVCLVTKDPLAGGDGNI